MTKRALDADGDVSAESIDLSGPQAKRTKVDGPKDTDHATALLKETASKAGICIIPASTVASVEEMWTALEPVVSPDCHGYARLTAYDEGVACLDVWPRKPKMRGRCMSALVDQLTVLAGAASWSVRFEHTGALTVRVADVDAMAGPPPLLVILDGDGCAWWSGRSQGEGKRCGMPGTSGASGVECCALHRCRNCNTAKAQNGMSRCRLCSGVFRGRKRSAVKRDK